MSMCLLLSVLPPDMMLVIDPFWRQVSRLFDGMCGLAADDMSQSKRLNIALAAPPLMPLLPPPFPN